MHPSIKRLTWLFLFSLPAFIHAADWAQFRGPGGNAVMKDAKIPTEWEESKNIAWTADLPGRGPSSPITVGNQVIVTSSSGPDQEQLHVLSFNAETGELNWHRRCWATGRTFCHPASANAAPTPASDGKYIYAFYSSNDLICLDLNGNLKWYRGVGSDFPKAGNDVGMSSSPVVASDTVVVQIEGQNDSFVTGINTETGEPRWRIDRPRESNWSSPVVMPGANDSNLVLIKGSDGLTAHDIVTGKAVWTYEVGARGIPSVLVDGSLVYLPGDELIVLDTTKIVDGQPEVVWATNRVRPGPASPLLANGKLYALAGRILTCADTASGEVEWQLRLKGDFWASPVMAGDQIVCVNLDGEASIVALTEEGGKIASTYEFGETIQGTPALAESALFVRSDAKLWKVSGAK